MIALLLAAALAAPAPLTPDALRERYGGLPSLAADVVQVKTGRYWARPFESRVRLDYTPERIVWETVRPVRSRVRISGGRLEVEDARGERREAAGAGDPRVSALVGFLQALLAFDLPRIERDFVLAFGDREVVATPRPGGAVPVFRRIAIRFDAAGELAALSLEAEAERTELTFSNVVRGARAAR